ncbi:MAG: AIR synthase family protein [Firmicutes bacterium]|nr:AIR synthase family protein [Bacillota bacterium]
MLKTGKLDSRLLERIVFDNIKLRRDEVITRPGIGEDCAVLDYGDYECVMSTDPITAAIDEIGRLSVHISCNDIASNGVEPVGIMLAVLLPEGTTEEQIDTMMKQAGQASEELNVEIIGGHTEITPVVKQPVIISTAVGRGPKNGSQSAENMKPGDYIMITKKAGMEGTGVIASDMEDELKGFLTQDEIDEAKAMLDSVSVVPEGVIAGKIGTHGMHDVTEGGILGAVWEMCDISGLGAEVWADDIPVAEVTRKICDHFDVDVLRLISSGAMVICVPEDKKEQMEKAVEDAGVPSTYIGRVREAEYGVRMTRNGANSEVDPPYSDEIYRVVAKK